MELACQSLLTVLINFGFLVFGVTDYVGDPNLTPALALGTVALLGVIGLIAGYFPARTASELDPVVAMKT